MFCGNCGEKMQDGAKFCGKCGWRLEVAEAVAAAQDVAEEKAAEVKEEVAEKVAEVKEAAEEKVAEVKEAAEEKVAEVKEAAEETVAEVKEAAEEKAAEVKDAVEEAAAAVAVQANAPVEEAPAQDAPKEGKKKKGLLILIPVIILALVGLAVGVVLFLNSLKRQEVDLSDAVTFQVTGYSGYGVATVVVNEDALEEKYEDVISDHTKIRWSEFIEEVELLEYETTSLAGLSNGDQITLTWEYDKEKAAEEYKVDILCESISYTVSGLTEVKKIDPFEDITVEFSGVSGVGRADIRMEGRPDYYDYFRPALSANSELTNGDEVKVTFDLTNKDLIAETFGYELSPAEKSYTVSGLTEYVTKDEQVTEMALLPMMASAEKHFYDHIKGQWVKEAAVKKLECVGHFISKPDSLNAGVKNVIGLIYKVNANLFIEERNLDVEYYYPVLFKNVVVREDGSFEYQESDIYRSYDRFYKQYEPENEEDKVPDGSWYFYGYETLEALKDEYTEHNVSWTNVTTEKFVEKNYTETVYASLKAEKDKKVTQLVSGNAEVLVADATGAFLESITSWQKTASVNGVKCVETVLYTGTVVSPSVPENYLDVVLEVSAKVECGEDSEEFPFYYVVRYPNVAVGADGKLTADLTARETVNGKFEKMLGEKEIYEAWVFSPVNVWVYHGYKTPEEAVAEEIRQGNLYYKKTEVIPYTAEGAADMTAWGNADDTAAVAAAEAAFRETTVAWPESASLNSVACVDTYLISANIPTEAKELAVLLKVNAEVAFADRSEAFDYFYMVRFGNAQIDANGAITVDEATKVLTDNPFTKMLGDEEVPGAEGEPALNVWNFSGYATAEEAEATVLAKRENHVNYTGVKVPEPVVEEPTVEDPAETPATEGDGTAEGADAVTPDAEGEAPAEPGAEDETPAEDGDAATEPVEEDVAA